ncbi:MAG: hypothetical protein GSR84_09000 [Desulfurococcales archaeon]|nr:hypothetical protein [Desulfurococcales archaeon]
MAALEERVDGGLSTLLDGISEPAVVEYVRRVRRAKKHLQAALRELDGVGGARSIVEGLRSIDDALDDLEQELLKEARQQVLEEIADRLLRGMLGGR